MNLTSARLRILSKKVFLFDCDGVLWEDHMPIKNAVNLIAALKAHNRKVFLVTNNSTKSRAKYLIKSNTLGFNISLSEVMCTAYAAAQYLKDMQYSGKLYFMGTQGMAEELDLAGIEYTGVGPDPGMSSSGGTGFEGYGDIKLDDDITGTLFAFDPFYNYIKLLKATSYVSRGGDFFATNEDAYLPSPSSKVRIPGTGSLLSSLKVACGREPDVIFGKPHPTMFKLIDNQLRAEGLDIPKSDWIMFGDRLDTDISFANKNGIDSISVFTGVNNQDDIDKTQDSDLKPTYAFDSVDAVFQLLNFDNLKE